MYWPELIEISDDTRGPDPQISRSRSGPRGGIWTASTLMVTIGLDHHYSFPRPRLTVTMRNGLKRIRHG